MFKIEPVQEKARQKELCEFFGVDFREEYFAYFMYDIDTEEPMGFSQFEIRSDSGYISELVSSPKGFDREAMFILGRQTMNFIDICGGHICYAKDGAGEEKLLSSIGFKRNETGELISDMHGMFDGHCGGHKVEI